MAVHYPSVAIRAPPSAGRLAPRLHQQGHLGQSAVYLGGGMVTGVAFGAVLLASAPAIVALFALPIAWTAVASLSVFADAAPWLDTRLALGPMPQEVMSATQWAHAASALAIWMLLPLLIGIWRITRREVAGMLVLYALLVVVLIGVGRPQLARAVAGFVPDCVVLVRRLLADPRVARRHRLLLVGLAGYLALPFDLVPDVIPVAGQLDDAIVVGLVLRAVLRGGGPELIAEHWPGPRASLDVVLRLAGPSRG
jgi:uncharacterized membrane protein YkvA (DUF1232 family)